MHSLVRLAKKTVETYIKEGKVLKPEKLTLQMKERAGTFVSIHKLGELRGCIGTIEPVQSNLAEEVIAQRHQLGGQRPPLPPHHPR